MTNIELTKDLSNDVERTDKNFDTIKNWLHLRNQAFGTTGIAIMQVAAAVETSELKDLKAVFDSLMGTRAAKYLRLGGKTESEWGKGNDEYYYAFVNGCLLGALEIIKKNRAKSTDENYQSPAIGNASANVRAKLSEGGVVS